MTIAAEPFERGDAACTIFRDGPDWDGRRAAAIGQLRFSSIDAGRELLGAAARMLAAEGVAAALGPMDGDTWHPYRAITYSDSSPPFLMEPTAGLDVAAAFEAAGFAPVSSYLSARAALTAVIGEGPAFAVPGVTVSPWDGAEAEGLIGQIFAMSRASFAGNRFYKPIDKSGFVDLYRPLFAAIDPRLVLLARDGGGALVGFLFAIPNLLEGARPRTVILKTYASTAKGVGRMLADTLHRRARDLGFAQVIHALMHEDNVSRSSSALFQAQPFRRYALFGRQLVG